MRRKVKIWLNLNFPPKYIAWSQNGLRSNFRDGISLFIWEKFSEEKQEEERMGGAKWIFFPFFRLEGKKKNGNWNFTRKKKRIIFSKVFLYRKNFWRIWIYKTGFFCIFIFGFLLSISPFSFLLRFLKCNKKSFTFSRTFSASPHPVSVSHSRLLSNSFVYFISSRFRSFVSSFIRSVNLYTSAFQFFPL